MKEQGGRLRLRDARAQRGQVGVLDGRVQAIRAALVGGWINVLVTDSVTAKWLLQNRG